MTNLEEKKSASDVKAECKTGCHWLKILFGNTYLSATILGALSGVLLSLCFPFVRCWPLVFVALVPFLLGIIIVKEGKKALTLGFTFGFVLHVISMYWLKVFGWGAPVALAIEKAIIPALVAWLAVKLRSKQTNFCFYAVGLAALYTLAEYLQTVGVFGMNWAFLSIALARVPLLLQTNSLWGMWGLSFAIALINVGLAEIVWCIVRRRSSASESAEVAQQEQNQVCADNKSADHDIYSGIKSWVYVSASLWAFIIIWGTVTLLQAPSLAEQAKQPGAVKWGLIQLSIPQEKRFHPFFADENFEALGEASHQAIKEGAEIIGWPETSVPYRQFLDDNYYKLQMRRLIRRNSAWYLVGSIESAPDNGSYNAISTWDNVGIYRERYNKWNIVPFGEYLPGREYWPEWIPGVKLVMNYKPGEGSCALQVKDHKVGVLICFESMCTWVARQHVLKGAEVLFAPTNDAWFKETAELPGHFDIDIMRAVELARPVLPVGNTGISGFIDRYGRVQQESAINEKNIMVDYVVPNSTLTLYARCGDWQVLIYALLLIGCFAYTKRNQCN